MEIDYYKNPFASKRMNVIARNGVVCTGNNLATQAGLRMLLQGGNAVDAAIATAACLTVQNLVQMVQDRMALRLCG